MSDTKTCSKCGLRRRIGRFDSDASRPDGLYSWCKDCKRTPRRRRQINQVRGAAHADSLESASRRGRPWTAREDEIVLNHPFTEAAARTGRTYWAVARRRFKLRSE